MNIQLSDKLRKELKQRLEKEISNDNDLITTFIKEFPNITSPERFRLLWEQDQVVLRRTGKNLWHKVWEENQRRYDAELLLGCLEAIIEDIERPWRKRQTQNPETKGRIARFFAKIYKRQDVTTPTRRKKSKVPRLIFAILIFFFGSFLHIMGALGVSRGLILLSPSSAALVPLQITIAVVLSCFFVFIFIASDFANITNKLNLSFKESAKVLDIYTKILQIISDKAKTAVLQPNQITLNKEQHLTLITAISTIVKGKLKEVFAQRSFFYKWSIKIASVLGGIFIISMQLFAAKSGAVALAAWIGFTAGPPGWLIAITIIAAFMVAAAVYYFSQAHNVENVISDMFGLNILKLKKLESLERKNPLALASLQSVAVSHERRCDMPHGHLGTCQHVPCAGHTKSKIDEIGSAHSLRRRRSI